jgi:16S rRNA (cytosine1402-N4)-methyltransferase
MSEGTEADKPPYHHEPAMCREVVDVLREAPRGVLVDATVGGGGHAAALLESLPHLQLVGIDRDPDALRATAERLAPQRHRVTLRHARFDALGDVLDEIGHSEVSACLFDLGVSSAQLDRPERGFSYRLDGPLDMRMDPGTAVTAADIVNGADEDILADILRRNADERHARRIAAAIVAQRPFSTTAQLSGAVAAAVPVPARRRSHPARRTFQALRIEVNGELEMLERALTGALERLIDSGRCAVLSYHSGEDRIVKSVFRRAAGEVPPPRPGLPPAPGPAATVRLVGRRSRTPTESEKSSNHRAGSARLRAVERLIRDV